jgi:hypothetical protein
MNGKPISRLPLFLMVLAFLLAIQASFPRSERVIIASVSPFTVLGSGGFSMRRTKGFKIF